MAYYKVCPNCGAHLDPGESCDCESEEKKRMEIYSKNTKINAVTGQLSFQWNGEDVACVDKK